MVIRCCCAVDPHVFYLKPSRANALALVGILKECILHHSQPINNLVGVDIRPLSFGAVLFRFSRPFVLLAALFQVV